MSRARLVAAGVLTTALIAAGAAAVGALRRPAADCALPPGAVAARLFHPVDGATLSGPWHLVALRADEGEQVTVCVDGARREVAGTFGSSKPFRGHTWHGSLTLADLAPGPHHLRTIVRPRGGGPPRVAEAGVTHARGKHRVRFAVTRAGRPTTARIVVTDGEEPLVIGRPLDDRVDRDAEVHAVFAIEGRAELWLDPGHYRFLGVRSVLDELAIAELDLERDTDLNLDLTPAIEAPEWLKADLHVHTARSQDGLLPDDLRFASLEAAGLDVAVLTDHDVLGDAQPALDALSGGRWGLRIVPGIESGVWEKRERKRVDVAHFNAFPLGPGTDRIGEFTGALADAYDFVLAGREGALLQLNHPRGIHFVRKDHPSWAAWGTFTALGLDPSLPPGEGPNAWMTAASASGRTALGVDALEVLNRFSLELYLAVRQDWFYLLNHGVRLTATGNSDSHAAERELAGMTLNLVRAPRPAPGAPLDVAAFAHAIAGGRVTVTTGPLVELALRCGGARVEVGGACAPGPAVAEVRIRAASWVPVPELRVVVDGRVVHREPLGGAGALDRRVEVDLGDLAAGSWVLAEAGWPDDPIEIQPDPGGDYASVAPLYVPIAFTNPVFVEPARAPDGG